MKLLNLFLVAAAAALLIFITSYTSHAKTEPAKPDLTQLKSQLPASIKLQTVVLGAGCFWGVEKRFEALKGVVNAVAGYADGSGVAPNYKAITAAKNRYNPDNFAEVVQVTFDPAKISLGRLLQHYFEQHDPTQLNRQGNDIGTQYRSTILVNNDQQLTVAKQTSAEYQPLLTAAGLGQITTVIKPLTQFYAAEDYHQDYLAKNPNGYCPDHATGVRFANSSPHPAINIDNTDLQLGKQIVVIESDSYCPYCEKFTKNVLNSYQGDITVHSRLASQLQGLNISSPTWATPTILFLVDGKEVFGHQGYMSPEQFYLALGHFKLGESEAFNVAFDEGTDGQFCQQYEIFKNTPDGVFVDKLSGAALFDTRDRFDSGTGWLSFTNSIAGAVTQRPDNRYGMQRTELRSKTSGIHLGHLFNDGPNGQARYCINATVLDFIPR
ncbi:peptide-methionine (S)-S-oxide reductase MsrA [Rheinheimera salexigens]|uniref:Peptide methionine sulfoxide reductase MsrA n=1 Tax=Rheinheimera salexigens TaxID=1628148 RepID=A0A1E7Q2H7_9GAMM|nr:peptide-methionine (S)-S-oxide reductase MsrA [Rheinheimera salexigens]OEY68253.1 peptide-methionine (S)-S-oxide reductase [Rheinheimera salexigens]